MAGKKDRSKIDKRRRKAKSQKAKKRKLRLIRGERESGPTVIERSGMRYPAAPEGFRSISFSHALMEYARPIMDQVKDQKDLEPAFQLSSVLWNYASGARTVQTDPEIEKKIMETAESVLGLEKEAARSLMQKMVERYNHLFPADVQPEPPSPFMFIRKEVRHLIRPFDSGKLNLSDQIAPPDPEDQNFIGRLNRLDSLISRGDEYDRFESLLNEIKDECEERFGQWLAAKGLTKDSADFAGCPFIFFDFVYGYEHEEAIILKTVSERYFVEFFEDYLIRKMMADPPDYAVWIPALKLFYQFLAEKGYVDKAEKFVRIIDRIEPHFIEILRKRFS